MKRNFLFLILLSFLSVFTVGYIQAADRISSYIPRLVKIASDTDLDSLSNQGVEILRRRGDILLCLFPDGPTRSGATSQRVRHITPALDIAKGYFNAGSIQNGIAFDAPFTGKGVVVGICDVGIDPLHPTFLDADGHSRIKRVVQYIESNGVRIQLEGDEDFRKWVTDNPEQFHATHVCGILAGAGAGSPFSGIATDADIVVTVSTLTEVGLLAGVEDIIDYAKEVGKPAVINISVGSYTGPHDGSSLFSQYLDMCADDAIIVLSSGNEGMQKNSLIADFGPDCSAVSFRLGNRAWDQYNMYGVTEIWSGSAEPLSVAIGVYDSDKKSIIRWFDDFTVTKDTPRSYLWEGTDLPEEGFPFVGELMVEGEVNPENGRHSTILSYDFTSDHQASGGGWARYELAVKVTGHPGNDV
ncbi:MAG: S8 family serine peptidase, partial [Muribaculaceae bacterium]|nr:S8 family serine peptidase [Muribaculaceae bacterium]